VTLCKHIPNYLVLIKQPFELQPRARRHTSTVKDHCPGLINFISQELATKLPQPLYIDTTSAQGDGQTVDLVDDELSADLLSSRMIREKMTTTKALADARLGQGAFRAEVGKWWGWRCAVTGSGIPEVLRASHIKPWAKSTNRERLNAENGIMLAAHVDALFGRGLMSFADDRAMLLSDAVGADERQILGLPLPLRRSLTTTQKQFLRYHRRSHNFG
jgi:hypothetical protein